MQGLLRASLSRDPRISLATLRRRAEVPPLELGQLAQPRPAPQWTGVEPEPPRAFGPDLLRRSIAHRIQERAFGGLSREHQRLLDQLVKAARTKPNGRIELPKRIKPGSELVRTWNRRTYRVVVMEKGFAWEGRTFSSLSEIAFEITGTKWNGPRFFGLRSSASRPHKEPEANDQ